MGWSIARKDGGTILEGQASINESGLATFGRHETTDDTTYVITYTDTDCGTITKDFIVKGCGEQPKVLACWRGTNNGTDYYEGGKTESNPILLCGCKDDNTGDSIYVHGGLQYKQGGEWYNLDANGFTPPDWVELKLTTTPMCCGEPHFNIRATKDFIVTDPNADHVRSVTFSFRAQTTPPDGKVPQCAGTDCGYEGAGKTLCDEWEYEIKQCAQGYCWCGEHSKNAVAVPCGECEGTVKRDCTDPDYCG